MVTVEQIHEAVGSRPTVVDVAKDMKLVDGEALDDVGDGHDEVVGSSCGDDGVDDDIHVVGLVLILRPLMEKLLDNVGEIGRQRFANLRTCVFA